MITTTRKEQNKTTTNKQNHRTAESQSRSKGN